MSSTRALAVRMVLALLGSGCARADLVARVPDDCPPGARCEPNQPPCAPRACAVLQAQADLCGSASLPVRTGDGCSDSPALPGFRFGLCSCSDLVSRAPVRVDAYGETSRALTPSAGALAVNGELSLAPGSSVVGELWVGGRVVNASDVDAPIVQSQPAPCDCAAERLLDIGALVAARQQDNDNASLALSADALTSGALSELSLPCGRYYFTRLAGAQPLTIRATGNVALFIDGNVELDDALHIQSEAGQLAVFVAGELRVGGALSLGGDPHAHTPAGLFVAGQGTLDLRGATRIVGSLYAPRAELVSSGTFELYGAALVRRASSDGELVIHYDTSLRTPAQCAPL